SLLHPTPPSPSLPPSLLSLLPALRPQACPLWRLPPSRPLPRQWRLLGSGHDRRGGAGAPPLTAGLTVAAAARRAEHDTAREDNGASEGGARRRPARGHGSGGRIHASSGLPCSASSCGGGGRRARGRPKRGRDGGKRAWLQLAGAGVARRPPRVVPGGAGRPPHAEAAESGRSGHCAPKRPRRVAPFSLSLSLSPGGPSPAPSLSPRHSDVGESRRRGLWAGELGAAAARRQVSSAAAGKLHSSGLPPPPRPSIWGGSARSVGGELGSAPVCPAPPSSILPPPPVVAEDGSHVPAAAAGLEHVCAPAGAAELARAGRGGGTLTSFLLGDGPPSPAPHFLRLGEVGSGGGSTPTWCVPSVCSLRCISCP
ncbi:hypothetical protein PVAP13_9KG371516, partial [Panicum virgatum]